MARPKPPTESVRMAHDLKAAGCSLAEIGETLGVTKMTAKRWCDLPAPPAEASAALPAHMAPAPPPAPDETDGDNTDSLAFTRAMQRRLLRFARDAETSGNMGAAQRAGRDAAGLVAVIARLERVEKDSADTLHLSRGDVAKAMAGVRERAEAILGRPLLCAECSRALSVRWGTGGGQQGGAPAAP